MTTQTPMDISDAARAVDEFEPDYDSAPVETERVAGIINEQGDTHSVQHTQRRMTLWRTDTGEELTILSAFYNETMSHKHPATGLPLYSRVPVVIPDEAMGNLVCALHPDAPDRALFDAMGLRTCDKVGFSNQFQVLRHLERRHPDEFAMIDANKKELERREQVDANKALVEMARAMMLQAQQPQVAAAPEIEPHQHRYDEDGN